MTLLNSPPLTKVADVPDSEPPLAPKHFIIQRPYNLRPNGNIQLNNDCNTEVKENLQQLMDHFWGVLFQSINKH